MASEVALSGRAAASLLARVADLPLRGRGSIEALLAREAASSFGRALAGSALASGVVSSSALASSEGRGPGGGVVGHRRRPRRPGGVGGRPHRRHGAGDRAPGEAAEASACTLPRERTLRCASCKSKRSFSLTKATTRSYFSRGERKEPTHLQNYSSGRPELPVSIPARLLYRKSWPVSGQRRCLTPSARSAAALRSGRHHSFILTPTVATTASHPINPLPLGMEDDPIEMLIMRNRSLIEKADLTRASSEDARTRSGIAKRGAQLIRRRIQGGRTWLQYGRTSP